MENLHCLSWFYHDIMKFPRFLADATHRCWDKIETKQPWSSWSTTIESIESKPGGSGVVGCNGMQLANHFQKGTHGLLWHIYRHSNLDQSTLDIKLRSTQLFLVPTKPWDCYAHFCKLLGLRSLWTSIFSKHFSSWTFQSALAPTPTSGSPWPSASIRIRVASAAEKERLQKLLLPKAWMFCATLSGHRVTIGVDMRRCLKNPLGCHIRNMAFLENAALMK